jgi:cyclopropane fatty-acyl-phospholipid synthase-like methyltransferase
MTKITDAVDMFNKSAKKYQEKFMDVRAYSESLNYFCEELDPTASIIEFGCGPGNVTRYLLDRCKDLNILSSDLAPEMVKLAKENCPEAKFDIIDIRSLESIGKRFDGILAGFCLPYLTKNEATVFLRNLANLLNPNGVVYLSTIINDEVESEVKTSSSGDSLRIYYYQKKYLESLLINSEFKIIETFELAENGEKEIIFIAKHAHDL